MSMAPARVARRPVHGVLLLDKPLGISSNDALQKVRWLMNAEKAGHTGTLDPLATGLLPCCFGAATKFSQVHLDADKGYEAILQLGVTTTTGDREGEVQETRSVNISLENVQTAIAQFTGIIKQTPHRYSAIAVKGKRSYEYAREGISIELESREITIHAIDILALVGDSLSIAVSCSKGTYIRVLAEDIGNALGCGAHLSALRRTYTGGLHVKEAITLQAIDAMSMAEREQLIKPADELLKDFPAITLPNNEAGRFLTGLRRRVSLADAPLVRVYGQEPPSLIGSAHIQGGELIPTRLLSPIEISQTLQQNNLTHLNLTSQATHHEQ
jgi:tRNA pseudouridine55 synthase